MALSRIPADLITGGLSVDPAAPADAITVDSSGKVGIGKTPVNKPLEIYSASDTALRLQNSTTGTGATDGLLLEASGSDVLLVNYENGNMLFYTDTTERMRIDSAGRVTKSYQVAFMAYKTGGDEFFGVGDTLKYDATLFNVGNAYNTSTYTFTAPIAGRYLFSINANAAKDHVDTGGVPRAYWQINNANVANGLHLRGTEVGNTGSLEQRESTVIFQLNAGDAVKMVVGQNTFDIFGANHFMGYLLG